MGRKKILTEVWRRGGDLRLHRDFRADIPEDILERLRSHGESLLRIYGLQQVTARWTCRVSQTEPPDHEIGTPLDPRGPYAICWENQEGTGIGFGMTLQGDLQAVDVGTIEGPWLEV